MLAVAAGGGGCDEGSRAEEGRQGAPLRIVGTVPPSGDGSLVAEGVPTNRVLRVRFDRFLRGDTAVRQSIVVFGGTPNADGSLPAAAFLAPTYDPVERVVTLRPDGDLAPSSLYTVRITRPSDEPNGFGFRAWDGAELDRSYLFQFKTGAARDPLEVGEVSTRCAACVPSGNRRDPGTRVPSGASRVMGDCGACHRGTDAPMGLDLSSYEGLQRTAFGRPAHETLTGPSTAHAEESPAILGVSMPIVSPGQPGNSYALYKLLLLSDWTAGEGGGENGRFLLPEPLRPDGGYEGGSLVRPDHELTRLHEAFVAGSAMPPTGYELGRLRTIARWIAEGAPSDAGCAERSAHCACDLEAKPSVTTGCAEPRLLGYTFRAASGEVVPLSGCACEGPDCELLFESAAAVRTACTTRCERRTPGSSVGVTETKDGSGGTTVTCADGSPPVIFGYAWDRSERDCAPVAGCGSCVDATSPSTGAVIAACAELYASCDAARSSCDLDAAAAGAASPSSSGP